MAEHFPIHEAPSSHEAHKNHEAHVPKHESAAEKSKDSHSEKAHHDKQELRSRVEHHAVSGAELASKTTEKNLSHQTVHHISKDIKDMTFERNMTRVRKRLNTPSQALSKVIHLPTIEKVSETAAKSVARPSGLLGGGIFAFSGTLLLLYLTRKYGYEFNYLMFFMLFIGGFLLGATIELLIFLARQRRNHDF